MGAYLEGTCCPSTVIFYAAFDFLPPPALHPPLCLSPPKIQAWEMRLNRFSMSPNALAV